MANSPERFYLDFPHGTACPGRQRGFTLIELMIVIAVVAILVTLAIPAYKDYTIRAKVTECINILSVPKTQISEFRQTMGRWPADASEAGVQLTVDMIFNGVSQYCWIETYLGDTGSVIIVVDGPALDPSIGLIDIAPVITPIANSSGSIGWECTRGATNANALKYLPSTCRDDNIL